jgi:hypothetical protein
MGELLDFPDMKTIGITTGLFITLAPALAAVLLWNIAAGATTAMGKKEKKECVVCHTGKGLYSLNDAGKYYQKNKKLPPAEAN